MSEIVLTIGGQAVSVGAVLAAAAALLAAALLALVVVTARGARARLIEAEKQALRSGEIEERLGEFVRIQSETSGRLQMLGENLSGRQAELARVMAERLDAVSHRVGQSVEVTARHTVDSLRQLHERLAVIDRAQKNISELTTQVSSLSAVLANKQARGAFGQGRMEAIVRDGLPRGTYEFQFTLTNGKRPDCAVFLPGDPRPLVIDAKFPLEAISAFREATSDEARIKAAARLRQDVQRHVNDISERYLIPGETQDLALMFVPSESVYAELHDGFDDLIQRAYRVQVVLVSPSLLMLAIQVMQQIQKDARMRAAAHEIRTEVGHLMDDVGRLRERVLKLQQHMGQTSEDLAQVLISADKIVKRGGRIEALEFDDPAGEGAAGVAGVVPGGVAAALPKLGAAE